MEQQKEAPTLGQYSLLKEHQIDQFGALYEAVNKVTQAPIILRLISPNISNNENFLIRFNILKTVLTSLDHQNLVRVEELGQENKLFYIAKQLPANEFIELKTLDEFDPQDFINKKRTIELLFRGIAEGLSILEQVKKSYYKEGVVHDCLTPNNVYISYKKDLIGSQQTIVPKIDNFAESFLFFGEGANATLRYHLTARQNSCSLYNDQSFFPYHARKGLSLNHTFAQYSFGALTYNYFAGTPPKGLFPPLLEVDPSLDPIWDNIVSKCLSAPYGNGFSSMAIVVKRFQELEAKRGKLPDEMKRLEEIEVPEGMALIAFTDKAEIGAPEGPSVEQPSFRARIKPFFLDLTAVTNLQFSEFMESHHRSVHSSGNQHPATLVSQKMAQAYCNWRSEKEGLPPGSYRLPTEYELETAARGSAGDQYPWGKEQNSLRLHCGKDSAAGTMPVKSFPSGRFGLHDILGNIWEWTSSSFKQHPFAKESKRKYNSSLFVVKGGCWQTPLDKCRGSQRAAFLSTERRGNIGFRCARNIDL